MVSLLRRHPFIVLVIPFALVFYFVYVGLGWNIWVSLTNWIGLRISYRYAGFGNYAKLFQDPIFWLSFRNTLLLFLIIPICIVIGLFLAVILDKGLKGSGFFRNMFLLPFALSFVVTGTLWAWMYNPANGILNSLVRIMGFDVLVGTWHTAQNTVMPAIILALVWQFSGYVALIFLAGLKSVPQNHINAAYLDGASSVKVFWRIILPQLRSSVAASIVVIAMYSLRSFDFIWVLTAGGARLCFPYSSNNDVPGNLCISPVCLRGQYCHNFAGAGCDFGRSLYLQGLPEVSLWTGSWRQP
ncbi:MAG: sugar ABC transporter permease [Limnochordia bacterium]